MFKLFLKLFIFLFFNGLFISAQPSNQLKLNEVRIIASHNSYKGYPHKKVLRFLDRIKDKLGDQNNPKQMDYGHLPLKDQLDSHGVRGFELDIYHDPDGSLFKKRKINAFILGLKQRVKDPKIKTPGFKLIHIPDVDYETNYILFKDALLEIKEWSDSHPNHFPIYINIEAKSYTLRSESKFLKFLGFSKTIPFSHEVYNQLDQEISSVFKDSDLLTPAILKDTFINIKARLHKNGWPTINSCLGKVIFILEGENCDIYRNDIEKGIDRPMFVFGSPNDNSTAFLLRNHSMGHEKEMAELSELYIIRTRSDAGTLEARDNNYNRFKSCLKSKAQIISTDYYKPDPRFGDFCIKFLSNNSQSPYILKNE